MSHYKTAFLACSSLLAAASWAHGQEASTTPFGTKFTDLPASIPAIEGEILGQAGAAQAGAQAGGTSFSAGNAAHHATPLAPFDTTSSTEALKKAVYTALVNGQNGAALQALALLEGRGDSDFATYGKAISLAQQGFYAKSMQELQRLMATSEPYKPQAQELESKLLLTLAEIAQIQGKTAEADQHLRAYYTRYGQGKQPARFVRLAKAQGWPSTEKDRQKTYPYLRVGVLLPFSGPLKDVGESLLQAIQLAIFETAEANILIYPEDTEGTAKGAEEAAERLLRLGVDVVLGPLLAANVDAASPRTRQAGVPMISFSSSAGVAGHNTFVMGLLPEQQTQVAVRHAAESSATVVASLVPQNPFGLEAFKAFEQQAETLNLTLLPPVYYNPKDADIGKALAKLLKLEESRKTLEAEKKTLENEFLLVGGAMDDASLARLKELRKTEVEAVVEFDALFLPISAQAMPLVAAQLAFYDVSPRRVLFLGTSQWENMSVLAGGADYVKGSRFAGTSVAGKAKFNTLFQGAYGHDPKEIAILGYDAVLILHQLMQEDVREYRHALDSIAREEGFHGLMGPYRFTERGLSERGYDLLELQRKGFKTLRASPVLLPPSLPQTLEPQGRASTPQKRLFNFWN